MKFLIVCCATLALLQIVNAQSRDELWQAFKVMKRLYFSVTSPYECFLWRGQAKFNRDYSPREDVMRQAEFFKVQDLIEKHNAAGLTWTMGHNELSDKVIRQSYYSSLTCWWFTCQTEEERGQIIGRSLHFNSTGGYGQDDDNSTALFAAYGQDDDNSTALFTGYGHGNSTNLTNTQELSVGRLTHSSIFDKYNQFNQRVLYRSPQACLHATHKKPSRLRYKLAIRMPKQTNSKTSDMTGKESCKVGAIFASIAPLEYQGCVKKFAIDYLR